MQITGLEGFTWRAQQDSNLWPLAPEASGGMSENPCKQGTECTSETIRCTSRCTHPAETLHETPKTDTIKAALSGLTRDEILSILADVVSGKIDGGEGARE